jgi:hypothetical protein
MAVGDYQPFDLFQPMAPDLLEQRRSAVRKKDRLPEFQPVTDAFPDPGKRSMVSKYIHGTSIQYVFLTGTIR